MQNTLQSECNEDPQTTTVREEKQIYLVNALLAQAAHQIDHIAASISSPA